MNAGELLNDWGTRIGYPQDKLAELIAVPALTQITLPDDFTAAVKSNVITIKEARNNADLKKHFAGVHLGSVDAVIKDLLDEYSIPDEIRGTIEGEVNTFDKIKVFSKHLASLKEEATKAVGGEKAKLVDQINALNSEIVKVKESAKKEADTINHTWQGRLTDHLINGHFSAYDYAMENVPSDVQAKTARMIVEQKLGEKGGKIKYTDAGIKLVSAQDDSLDFTIDHKPVEFKAFSDTVLAEAKLLKVKGAAPVPPAGTPPTGAAAGRSASPVSVSAIDKALADFGGQ